MGMHFNIPSSSGSSESAPTPPSHVPSVSPAPIPIVIDSTFQQPSSGRVHIPIRSYPDGASVSPHHATALNLPSLPATEVDYPEYEELERDDDLWTRTKDFFHDNQEVTNTFVAGGLAGAASRTVVSPLERLKIILQVQSSQPGGQGQAYGGVYASLKRMWKNEGFAGFMKGNGINVIRILPYSALQFTSYSGFKTLLRNWSGEEVLSAPLRLTAGAGAGIVAVCATYPLDLVRARLSIATANMAASKAAFSAEDAALGMVGMTKKVYRTEGGIRGLYRGCWATALGVAPYVSLNFFTYENLKHFFMVDGAEMGDIEFAARKLGCGGLAGAISLLFTHPFDVLRRKMQVSGLQAITDGTKPTGAIQTLKDMVKVDGFWKGMYRGLVPNLVKIVPSMAVSFYTFDTVHDAMGRFFCPEEEDDSEWS